MCSIRTLTLTALAFAPVAFAQNSTIDTASGKHFAVVGGVSLLQTKNDPLDGVRKVDGGPAPTLSASVTPSMQYSTGPLRARCRF